MSVPLNRGRRYTRPTEDERWFWEMLAESRKPTRADLVEPGRCRMPVSRVDDVIFVCGAMLGSCEHPEVAEAT